MTRRAALAAAAVLALGLSWAPPTRAGDDAPPDLYQDALQSIAEGRKNDASATLNSIIVNEPQHAGAWLDLALIQCSLGNEAEAERMFDVILQRFAPPPGIIELIASTRATGCSQWHPHSDYSITMARGIDQNVNQGAATPNLLIDSGSGPELLPLQSDFLPKHDQYSALWLDYARDLTANGTTGFVQFQDRRNDRQHQYDSGSLFVGAETPWRAGHWTATATGTLGLFSLGGQYYQRQSQVQLKVGPPLPLPERTQFTLTAALSHNKYMTLSNFDAIASELRGQLVHRADNGSLSASMAWLTDRALSDRPGGNRHGWLASVTARRTISGPVSGELGYSQQDWRSSSAYSPGLIDATRAEATQIGRASMTWSLGGGHSLQLEARRVRNAENISIFQYNDRQLQLSWQWLAQ